MGPGFGHSLQRSSSVKTDLLYLYVVHSLEQQNCLSQEHLWTCSALINNCPSTYKRQNDCTYFWNRFSIQNCTELERQNRVTYTGRQQEGESSTAYIQVKDQHFLSVDLKCLWWWKSMSDIPLIPDKTTPDMSASTDVWLVHSQCRLAVNFDVIVISLRKHQQYNQLSI